MAGKKDDQSDRMNLNSGRYSLTKEHKEIGRDIINVIISYTPVSGIFDTVKFVNKWVVKRKSVHRIAYRVERFNRKLRLKGRIRRRIRLKRHDYD